MSSLNQKLQLLENDKLKFEDLTKEQLDYFCNGVGSAHFPINPHDLIFKSPSKRHDFLYWLGGTDEDRILADEIFYLESLLEIGKQKWIPCRLFYFSVLELYMMFLRPLGKYAFEYGSKRESWDELKKFIDEKKVKQ